MALYTDYRTVENTVTDAAAINDAIKNILFTRKGSLPGKPEFGSRLHEVIFSQLDSVTEDLLRTLIKEALTRWEKRILVTSVFIEDVPEFNKLIANINYMYIDKGLEINESISLGLVQ